MESIASPTFGAMAITSIFLAQALSAALALAYGLAFLGLWRQFRRAVTRSIASGWLIFGGSAALSPLLGLESADPNIVRWVGAAVTSLALLTGPAFADAAFVAAGGGDRRTLWVSATVVALVSAVAIGFPIPVVGPLVQGPAPRLIVACYLAWGVAVVLARPAFAGRRSLALGLALLAARMLGGLTLELGAPSLLTIAGQPTWFTIFQLLTTMLSGFYLGAFVFALERSAAVTERLALERRLADSQRIEALGRMARNVAHDFNNILAAIASSAGTGALDGATAAECAIASRDVDAAVERGTELTRALLSFSKPSAAAVAPLEVARRLEGLAPMLQRIAGGGCTVHTSVAPSLRAERARVLGDEVQFDQVLCNLVANARDACGGRGDIHVSADYVSLGGAQGLAVPDGLEGAACAVVSVADNGSGIPEAIRGQIFEPFFTTKEPGKGTGLGLAAAYAFAQQARGQITVESVSGKGSTFRLFLPLADDVSVSS